MHIRFCVIALLTLTCNSYALQCPAGCQTQISALDERVKKLEQAQFLPYAVTRDVQVDFRDTFNTLHLTPVVQGLNSADLIIVVLRSTLDIDRGKSQISNTASVLGIGGTATTSVPHPDSGVGCSARLSVSATGQAIGRLVSESAIYELKEHESLGEVPESSRTLSSGTVASSARSSGRMVCRE
jgi:hypothetical protein